MSDESSNVIVSVIIPVHNAAEYIAETLTTVLAQSLKEIEIILVNDSSTDNTLDIVAKIASEDSRVRVITNPSNVGGGDSRNIGLRVATGEYIIFLDDDDYADKEMLKRMSDRATALQTDVVICRCLIIQNIISSREVILFRVLRISFLQIKRKTFKTFGVCA